MKIPGSITIFSILLLLTLSIFSGQIKFEIFFNKDSSQVQGVNTENIEADQVQEVIDGDTFILGNGEKVRLIGINAPESGQPYYEKSKSHLEKLLSDKSVKLITDTQVQDQYGRILAYAYTGKDVDINLDLITNGFAVTETIAPNVSRADALSLAQAEARNNCVGIWEGLCSQENLCVQISEIQAKSTNGSRNGEWIEFSNTCSRSINMAGYLLKDNSASNDYHFGNIVLDAKKSLKLYTGCGTNTDKELYWECPEQSSYVWNDAGDRGYLYNNEGKLISELGY